ncbi:MAG: hypothetical protein OHK0022_45040 [Roseiflexaceae bacterium]
MIMPDSLGAKETAARIVHEGTYVIQYEIEPDPDLLLDRHGREYQAYVNEHLFRQAIRMRSEFKSIDDIIEHILKNYEP